MEEPSILDLGPNNYDNPTPHHYTLYSSLKLYNTSFKSAVITCGGVCTCTAIESSSVRERIPEGVRSGWRKSTAADRSLKSLTGRLLAKQRGNEQERGKRVIYRARKCSFQPDVSFDDYSPVSLSLPSLLFHGLILDAHAFDNKVGSSGSPKPGVCLPRATISSVPLFNLIAASCYFAVALLFLHSTGSSLSIIYSGRVEFDSTFFNTVE